MTPTPKNWNLRQSRVGICPWPSLEDGSLDRPLSAARFGPTIYNAMTQQYFLLFLVIFSHLVLDACRDMHAEIILIYGYLYANERPQKFLQGGKVYLLLFLSLPLFLSCPFFSHPFSPLHSFPPYPLCPALSIMPFLFRCEATP